MRDPDLLIELIGKMNEQPDGQLMVVKHLGMDANERKTIHHLDLLEDIGLAVWESENAIRITAQGYDFLNALEAQPKAKPKFLDFLSQGADVATAVAKMTDFVNKLIP